MNWKDVGLSLAWRVGLGQSFKRNPAWQITKDELAGISLRWPVTYEWPAAKLWAEPFLSIFRGYVPIRMSDIPQTYKGIVLFQVEKAGKVHDVVIDYFDLREVNPEAAKRALVYFKMQCAKDGYEDPRIRPGGYVPDSRKLYMHLPSLRRERDKRRYDYDVYGRFSLDYARERRRQAIEILKSQKRFGFEGGLEKVGYVEFLGQISRAKICIDLPGNGDFCHRLVNYMAVGACVIALPHGNQMHVPLEDRRHIVYTKDDLSDLVDLCAYYLENDEEREHIATESRRYFDLNLHRGNLGAYYLRTILDQLAASS